MSRGKRNDVDCARCLKVQPGTGDTWGIPTDDGTLVIHAMCMVWNEDAEMLNVHILFAREQQECIPSGCVPPAAVAVPDPGQTPQAPPWVWAWKPTRHAGIHDRDLQGMLGSPPPCGQTDTCKNITFTNFVCGR